ncbi:hypothetical protein J4E91_003147 [Alternaria rosae]|nr:hypothetical protein J4E91_003147 [Alternaria rosae]
MAQQKSRKRRLDSADFVSMVEALKDEEALTAYKKRTGNNTHNSADQLGRFIASPNRWHFGTGSEG